MASREEARPRGGKRMRILRELARPAGRESARLVCSDEKPWLNSQLVSSFFVRWLARKAVEGDDIPRVPSLGK